MTHLQINGGAFADVPDPAVSFGGRDTYGYQGKKRVVGRYRAFTLTIEWMTDTEFTELYYRIESANGERVAVTVPITSSSAWASLYANVEIAAGWTRKGDKVFGVVIDFTRASESL